MWVGLIQSVEEIKRERLTSPKEGGNSASTLPLDSTASTLPWSLRLPAATLVILGLPSMYRGWDGWMASSTQWTWVWVYSGSWWWTGRPGVLLSKGLQRVGHDWATELNWLNWARTCLNQLLKMPVCLPLSQIHRYKDVHIWLAPSSVQTQSSSSLLPTAEPGFSNSPLLSCKFLF